MYRKRLARSSRVRGGIAASRTRRSATALASLVSISCPPFARAGRRDLRQPGRLSPPRGPRGRWLRTGGARGPPRLPRGLIVTRCYARVRPVPGARGRPRAGPGTGPRARPPPAAGRGRGARGPPPVGAGDAEGVIGLGPLSRGLPPRDHDRVQDLASQPGQRDLDGALNEAVPRGVA